MLIATVDTIGMRRPYLDWSIFEVDESIVDPEEFACNALGIDVGDRPYDDYFDSGDVITIDYSDDHSVSELEELWDEAREKTGERFPFEDFLYELGYGYIDEVYYSDDLFDKYE